MPATQRTRPQTAPLRRAPPPDDDDTTLTKANALSCRVKVTQQSLLRIRPTLAFIEEKRLKEINSAVAGEKLMACQMVSGEEIVMMLAAQLRTLMVRVDGLAIAKATAATPPRPSRAELLKQLRAANSLGAPAQLDVAYDLAGLDLSYTVDLAGCAFAPKTRLQRTSFECAELSGCDLTRTQLGGARLAFAVGSRTTLAGADASGADFAHCRLTEGVLTGCNLRRADLSGSSLRDCELSGAALDDATLVFTDLTGCVLTGASLRRARLAGVRGLASTTIDNLVDAVLTACDVTGLDLRGVDVTGAVFAGVLYLGRATLDNLRGAKLAGATLAGCELGGCDLSGAELAGADFCGATAGAPARLRGVSGLESFPLGTVESVQAGALVALDGFLICVTGEHPANCHYAYYRTHAANWAQASMSGCFEKRHCRVLAP